MADMNQQQSKTVSLERRRAFAWVMGFALLFGVLAMPMTPTMPRTQGEQLAQGSVCSSRERRLLATSAPPVDQRNPDRADQRFMLHCPCCAERLSMVAVPAANQPGFTLWVQPLRFVQEAPATYAPEPVLWPNLNLGAAPRV